MKPFLRRHLKLLLIVMAVCALPILSAAQTEQNQDATSNGAGVVSGGNYTGYFSAGQIATYMYANGTQIATQGIILNEISGNVEFTFELNGNLNENPDAVAGQLVMKSAAAELAGTPLAGATVYLILASDSSVFASTQTDENGFYQFTSVPYKDFFFTVNTPVVPANPVVLELEQSTVFVKEVEIFGEVGTDGIEANVALTPQLTTGGDEQEYATWYLDSDGDGYGDPNFTVKLNLNAEQTGYVQNNLDCDDKDDGINPDAIDAPGTGIDANCDGLFTWYRDTDLDGFGSEMLDSSLYDYPMAGQSENNLDCDDNEPFINPDAIDEPGSGIDANCDGIILECTGISEVLFEAPYDPVQVGYETSILASYSGDTPYSASWNWGDGSSSDGTISEDSVSGSHVYDSAGVYILHLTLTDSCERVTTHEYKYVVIYDPAGGFVTGNGIIYSPAGASPIFPDAEGYASFGFVSKYDKKKGIPKGNTEFQFDAGNLDFVSTDYDWLVVSGSKAKFKGRGSINGDPGYQFMVSAIDGDLKQKGDPDIFRIKIWVEETQEVIYDNEMGVSVDQDPTSQVSEGSIVVHDPKVGKKSAVTGTENLMDGVGELSVTAFPNPTKGKVMLDISADSDELIKVLVVNITGQEILRKEVLNTRLVEIDLSGNTAGVYYIRTEIRDEVFTNKLILQHR
ncbi:T9SS type A sorting domain-containing protein [uncultured Draconibacterium sp.]|uniref:T9SS type A sorting domain-containing protein n=1 Tax=uncultured Draconibacterium sp. TaxID=1573823 RepID=UPI0025E6AB5F|nr:T9SS type A sorting domain-containing protein [uncultured Draconibacterium sp.]